MLTKQSTTKTWGPCKKKKNSDKKREEASKTANWCNNVFDQPSM